MKKKTCVWGVLLGVLGLCLALSGCGEKTSANISVQPGEHLDFGTYQGEPVEWRVLDVNAEDGEVLLLSEYGLDVKPYHDKSASGVSWEDCSLRRWLNGEFYESAFKDEEKERILLSESEGFAQYNSRVAGGKYDLLERETKDYVFLLSYTEVQEYFQETVDKEGELGKTCQPTEYAQTVDTLDRNMNGGGCGWWLCAGSRANAEQGRHIPFVVTAYGGVDIDLGAGASSMRYAVRPAIWVKWQEEEDET